jgi:hypothetical protein
MSFHTSRTLSLRASLCLFVGISAAFSLHPEQKTESGVSSAAGVTRRKPSTAGGGPADGPAYLGARDFRRRDYRAGAVGRDGLFHDV